MSISKRISPTIFSLVSIIVCALFFFRYVNFSFAETLVDIPKLSQRVTDTVNLLSPSEKQSLESLLSNFEVTKGPQIAVLTVATTKPETIEQYALRVVENWKLGRAKIDDGVLVLVAKNDRSLRIEVGYGLEGALNDATSKRIIDEIITPEFKNGNFGKGIIDGVNKIIAVINGEPLPEPSKHSNSLVSSDSFLFVLIITTVIGSALVDYIGRLPSAGLAGTTALIISSFSLPDPLQYLIGLLAFFLILISGSSLARSARGGGYSSGSSGGGFSSGGFSGGGGSFGGGGASGKW